MVCSGVFAELDVEHQPVHIWAAQEVGMLQSGVYWKDKSEFKDEWIDNYGAGFSKEALINERLKLAVGIKGVFRFAKPEIIDTKFAGTQAVRFFVGPTVAEGSYVIAGDRDQSILEIGAGLFPYQYNPDAHHLGGYLFRGIAYPSVLFSGGTMLLNDTQTPLQGVRLSSDLGSVHTDLLFTTETSVPPFYDWSLSLVSDVKILDGLLEIGGGVSFKRVLPMFPDSTTPKILKNLYFPDDSRGVMLSGNAQYYSARKGLYDIWATDTIVDAYQDSIFTYLSDSLNQIVMDLNTLNPQGAFNDSLRQYYRDSLLALPGAGTYTNQSVSLMFRLALNLGKALPEDFLGENDLRLYTEMNLLGWKDYPIYYEDKMERFPVMFGFNLPTFKLLDLFAVQLEYFKSPYLNNHFNLGDGNIPLPAFDSDELFSEDDFYSITRDNNWYWSVLLRKSILSGIHFTAQMGRDHLRVSSPQYFYGNREEAVENLSRGDDWYWAFQIAWGL